MRRRKRRLSDKLRTLADKAWARGSREVSTSIHEAARRAETERARYEG